MEWMTLEARACMGPYLEGMLQAYAPGTTNEWKRISALPKVRTIPCLVLGLIIFYAGLENIPLNLREPVSFLNNSKARQPKSVGSQRWCSCRKRACRLTQKCEYFLLVVQRTNCCEFYDYLDGHCNNLSILTLFRWPFCNRNTRRSKLNRHSYGWQIREGQNRSWRTRTLFTQQSTVP